MRLYVGWQDAESRRWYTVGLLSTDNDVYTFSYTKGALAAEKCGNFKPFTRMNDLTKVYRSSELFPLFSNRILPRSRPEYSDYLKWLGFKDNDSTDPLSILARSGGETATDNIQVFPMAEKTDDGKYEAYFFVQGIRYLHEDIQEMVMSLEEGSAVFPMLDYCNPKDKLAVALRANDPALLIGYCPRHLAKELGLLVKNSDSKLQMFVKRVNKTAPYQMRLSCKIEALWPDNFQPCDQEECEPLVSFDEL